MHSEESNFKELFMNVSHTIAHVKKAKREQKFATFSQKESQ